MSSLPRTMFCLAAATLLLSGLPSPAATEPGDLDPGFGVGGFAATGIASDPLYPNDYAFGIVLQPDGKIVLAGHAQRGRGHAFPDQEKIAVVRYGPSGALDTTFGSGGVVTTLIHTHNNGAFALAGQQDGKLLVGGYADYTWWGYDFSLVRYLPDGSLDPGFGSDGIVRTEFAPSYPWNISSLLFALTVQPDGRIIAAGHMTQTNYDREFALARYHADGTLDTSFGGDGKVITNFGAGRESARDVVLQPDGKIVAAGFAWNGTDYDIAVARFEINGSLDTSFGTGGRVTTAIGPDDDQARAVVVQDDGKIVVAGFASGPHRNIVLLRYEPDGSLDAGFGSGGILVADFGDTTSASELIIDSEHRLVVAGTAWSGDFALTRFGADGALDTDFGVDGLAILDSGNGDDVARCMTIQPDGMILVAGDCKLAGSGWDFCVARVDGGPVTPAHIEFAGMTFDTIIVEYQSEPAIADDYSMVGSFLLDPDSDGVDLTAEDVIVELGAWQLTLPGGWLEDTGSVYAGTGIIDGAEVTAAFRDLGAGEFQFWVEIRSANLGGTHNPTRCGLSVGNDGGGGEVRLDGGLRTGTRAFIIGDD